MAKIDERVMARRQKDLAGYTEMYQERLERMTAQHVKSLADTWKTISAQLQKRIKQLYQEAQATQDPKKLRAYMNTAARLKAYMAQLGNDLKVSNARLQPFFTYALKNQFEDSYYFTAFGVEQSAKVSAVVPILTPAQVLGVIANPWLGDGANYATRLNANMALFAKGVQDSVKQAVEEGWGWDKTARAIQERTQESYFRAVRLARTELTRAASQGASYSYMQNADILDGKRWNAVKDHKTAPKDAANDGKIYDLDYDTATNPGIPGQRIPNHPHCRCLWSPVLSALGVQQRERIARRDGGPDSWGKNYYTKAKTYREYAKERGLPDLDERLARDNPKKYLRPGESVESLAKKVVRWTYKGTTISVARPDWETLK